MVRMPYLAVEYNVGIRKDLDKSQHDWVAVKHFSQKKSLIACKTRVPEFVTTRHERFVQT